MPSQPFRVCKWQLTQASPRPSWYLCLLSEVCGVDSAATIRACILVMFPRSPGGRAVLVRGPCARASRDTGLLVFAAALWAAVLGPSSSPPLLSLARGLVRVPVSWAVSHPVLEGQTPPSSSLAVTSRWPVQFHGPRRGCLSRRGSACLAQARLRNRSHWACCHQHCPHL